jgi:hypothetical protein
MALAPARRIDERFHHRAVQIDPAARAAAWIALNSPDT